MSATDEKPVKQKSRGAEIALTISGGIFGIIGALFALAVGGIQSAVGDSSGNISNHGWFALLFSTLALVSLYYMSKNPKLAGKLLLVSAFGGLISISFFFVLPFILLLIAGIMCLKR